MTNPAMVEEKNHDFGSLVCIYSQMLPKIREAGKKLGYAIAVHGSMKRDFDLLAVPWVDDARPAQELVDFIAQEVHGYVIGDVKNRGELKDPTTKPHGRLSWNICWGGNAFIDLSVMPRSAPERAAGEEDIIASLRLEIDSLQKQLNAAWQDADPPICRLQLPDGTVPECLKDCAYAWKAAYDNLRLSITAVLEAKGVVLPPHTYAITFDGPILDEAGEEELESLAQNLCDSLGRCTLLKGESATMDVERDYQHLKDFLCRKAAPPAAEKEDAPFTITGPGVYETRDGFKAEIEGRHGHTRKNCYYPWNGHRCHEDGNQLPITWNDSGRSTNGVDSDDDLVRRIGPLPEHATSTAGTVDGAATDCPSPPCVAPGPGETRPCTCHPDDAVTPCAEKFAASECQAAPLPGYRDAKFPDDYQERIEVSEDGIGWVPACLMRIDTSEMRPYITMGGNHWKYARVPLPVATAEKEESPRCDDCGGYDNGGLVPHCSGCGKEDHSLRPGYKGPGALIAAEVNRLLLPISSVRRPPTDADVIPKQGGWGFIEGVFEEQRLLDYVTFSFNIAYPGGSASFRVRDKRAHRHDAEKMALAVALAINHESLASPAVGGEGTGE